MMTDVFGAENIPKPRPPRAMATTATGTSASRPNVVRITSSMEIRTIPMLGRSLGSETLSDRRPKAGVATACIAGCTSMTTPASEAESCPMLWRYSARKKEMEYEEA